MVLGEMVVTGIRSEDSRGLTEAAETVVKAEVVAILMVSIVVARNSMINGVEVIGYRLNRGGLGAVDELIQNSMARDPVAHEKHVLP